MRVPFPSDSLSQIGAVLLILLILTGLVGWASNVFGSPTALGGTALSAPGIGHPLGTDQLGRSVLARTVAGIHQTILLATAAVLIAAAIGSLLGMLAGYSRGAVDEIVSRCADALFSFPAIVLAIMISAIFQPGSASAIAAVIIVTLPVMVRVVRAATLAVAEQDFVIQARIAESSLGRILSMHIFPNVAGTIIVQMAYSISFGMIIESGVSFLGLGVQPPGASLGSLLHEGRVYLSVAPWLVFFPGAVLALTILSVNLVGDGLREVIDPLLE
jgi:peptide/nickel transport system permease protein